MWRAFLSQSFYVPDGLEEPSQVKAECRLEVKTYLALEQPRYG